MSKNIEVNRKDIIQKTKNLLISNSLREDETDACLRSWLYAHDSEKFSHGLDRLPWLLKVIKKGEIVPGNEPAIHKSKQTIKVEGNKSLGYLAIDNAVSLSIEIAKEYGISTISLSDCYPTGCMGQYVEEIAKNDLIGFVISSSPARVSAYGTTNAIFGTLGHSFGFPSSGEIPYIYDSSVSSISHGQIQYLHKIGENLPKGEVYTRDGNSTLYTNEVINENGVFEGIISIAGEKFAHKYSGLAGSLELLCRLALVNIPEEQKISGYSFILAINPEMFGEVDRYKDLVSDLQTAIKGGRKAKGIEEVYFAGEKSFKARSRNFTKETISVSEETFNILYK
jgi:LDH2 family malate/lactate/ureidoglycolate dehydrogenase